MTVSTMTFRTARQRNVILAVVGASMLVSLLLLSQTHSRLRRAEGDLEKCQQKHDSVAAQLTVLYEHKARLDKTLQAEIERKKLVDDELKTIQAAFSKERVTQSEKQAKMLREFERLKENGTEEISRMRSSYESLRREKEKLEADVEELNSQAQRLRETNHKLEEEVRKMQQSEPIDMNEVERLRERVRQCDSVQPVAAGQEQSANERVLAPPPVRHRAPASPAGPQASSRRPMSSTLSRRDQRGIPPSPLAQPREFALADSFGGSAANVGPAPPSLSHSEMHHVEQQPQPQQEQPQLQQQLEHQQNQQQRQEQQQQQHLLNLSHHDGGTQQVVGESPLGDLQQQHEHQLQQQQQLQRQQQQLQQLQQPSPPSHHLVDVSSPNVKRHGLPLLQRIAAGHDAESRFYALVPANAANVDQLRSKHGVRTFYR